MRSRWDVTDTRSADDHDAEGVLRRALHDRGERELGRLQGELVRLTNAGAVRRPLDASAASVERKSLPAVDVSRSDRSPVPVRAQTALPSIARFLSSNICLLHTDHSSRCRVGVIVAMSSRRCRAPLGLRPFRPARRMPSRGSRLLFGLGLVVPEALGALLSPVVSNRRDCVKRQASRVDACSAAAPCAVLDAAPATGSEEAAQNEKQKKMMISKMSI